MCCGHIPAEIQIFILYFTFHAYKIYYSSLLVVLVASLCSSVLVLLDNISAQLEPSSLFRPARPSYKRKQGCKVLNSLTLSIARVCSLLYIIFRT